MGLRGAEQPASSQGSLVLHLVILTDMGLPAIHTSRGPSPPGQSTYWGSLHGCSCERTPGIAGPA